MPPKKKATAASATPAGSAPSRKRAADDATEPTAKRDLTWELRQAKGIIGTLDSTIDELEEFRKVALVGLDEAGRDAGYARVARSLDSPLVEACDKLKYCVAVVSTWLEAVEKAPDTPTASTATAATTKPVATCRCLNGCAHGRAAV